MALQNICGQPLSNCETIDRDPDDAALANARIAFPNAKRHGSTLKAVNRLLPCLKGVSRPPKRGMILGHGMSGLIITGTGRVASDRDKKIDNDDFAISQPHLALLNSEITELTLCACEIGAGDAGASLLAKVADVINARAAGFTGLIFIDTGGSITCEKGGQWQYANPGTVPPSIPAPEYPIDDDDMVSLKLKDKEKYITLPVSAVLEVKYFPADIPEHKPPFSLRGDEAQQLVRTINFAEPREFVKSAPLAVSTANLEIQLKLNEGTRVWRFTVFNNRLLQDQTAPDTFYFASPDFIKRVREHLEPPHDEQTPPKGKQKPPQGERKPSERKPSYDKKS